MADTVAVIVGGAVVEKGRLQDLIRREGSIMSQHATDWLEPDVEPGAVSETMDDDTSADVRPKKKKSSRKKKHRSVEGDQGDA